MQWMSLIVTLGCLLCLPSLVFSAPQDIPPSVIKQRVTLSSTENVSAEKFVETITKQQTEETSKLEEISDVDQTEYMPVLGTEEVSTQKDEKEVKLDVYTSTENPLSKEVTQQSHSDNQKPATEETTEQTVSSIHMTITRPTKKPNKKPKPKRTTTVQPSTEKQETVTTSQQTQTANQKPSVEEITEAAVSSAPATINTTRPIKKPTKKPKPARATTVQPATENQEINTLQQTETVNQKPAVEEITETAVSYTPATITITRPTKKPTKKPKPVRATTVQPLTEVSTVSTPTTSSAPTRRYPCSCGGGLCSCCTGILLENFNVPFRSRACANVTYEPDDFAFNFKLLYNDRVLYNTRMSGKNPPPACIPINRFFGIKMCAKLTNVFLSGPNAHACLEMEGFFDNESTFNYAFNCFRIGSSGVAVVKPEDGGGLPPPPPGDEEPIEEYDDNV